MKLDSRLFLGALAAAGVALAAWSGATGITDAPAPPAAPAGGEGAEVPPALPEGHPDIPAATTSDRTVTGVVEETIQGGGYTYARLSTDGGEVWTAGPPTDLATGETVALAGVMDMGAFTSPTLDRTFERLLFTDRFVRATGTGPATGPSGGAFRGTVKRAIEASRYVYLEVETEDGPTWLAAPETELAEGDVVRWEGGTLMRDFASPSLDRTFDEILFVTGLRLDGG